MKFTISKTMLEEGLNKVSKVLNKKVTTPILAHIHCEVTEEELKLIGSNATETVIYKIPVNNDVIKVETVGATILPSTVVSIVKKFKKDITFSLKDFNLQVTSGQSKFSLNALDPEEYPKLDGLEAKESTITFKGDEFKAFVKRTIFAAAKSETRPILQGVQYRVEDGWLFLDSTDSHRLAQVKCKTNDTENMNIVVPASALETALKIFDESKEVEVFMRDERSLYFVNGHTSFISRLLEGKYPEVQRLIPHDFKTIVKMDRKDMLDGLELVSGITDDDQSIVRMHINGIASFQAQGSQRGKGKIDIPYLGLEGEDDFTISFSIPYAVDALKSMDSDVIDIKLVEAMRPFLIVPEEQKDMEELQLILPVRTQ